MGACDGGASNAVNITDGLDGLATVPSVFCCLSGYFGLYHRKCRLERVSIFTKSQNGELSIVAFCMVGALLGFLWYNSNPAEVFMGDSGSLPYRRTDGIFGRRLKE